MFFVKLISVLALAVSVLAGCDHIALSRLKAGESTSDDVRRELGEPSFVWAMSHGQQLFEYAGVPDISRNYMMLIGANGVLQAMRQVVVEENFKRIVRGMSQDEVRRVLGETLLDPAFFAEAAGCVGLKKCSWGAPPRRTIGALMSILVQMASWKTSVRREAGESRG